MSGGETHGGRLGRGRSVPDDPVSTAEAARVVRTDAHRCPLCQVGRLHIVAIEATDAGGGGSAALAASSRGASSVAQRDRWATRRNWSHVDVELRHLVLTAGNDTHGFPQHVRSGGNRAFVHRMVRR